MGFGTGIAILLVVIFTVVILKDMNQNNKWK
jgi:hypothetical protein